MVEAAMLQSFVIAMSVVGLLSGEGGGPDETPRNRSRAPCVAPYWRIVWGRGLDRLVWRFRSPHHSCGTSEMRTSEPKPH